MVSCVQWTSTQRAESPAYTKTTRHVHVHANHTRTQLCERIHCSHLIICFCVHTHSLCVCYVPVWRTRQEFLLFKSALPFPTGPHRERETETDSRAVETEMQKHKTGSKISSKITAKVNNFLFLLCLNHNFGQLRTIIFVFTFTCSLNHFGWTKRLTTNFCALVQPQKLKCLS